MTNLLLEIEVEGTHIPRRVHVEDRLIGFERFLEMAREQYVDLINGAIVEKPVIQLDHELCTSWIYQLLGPYARKLKLGRMLSSRIMVKTDSFGGRMPDLLFVSQSNFGIVKQLAVYGAPDLIIEVVSPHDRPSDLRSLEADYYRLGVPELIFINLQKLEIRSLLLTTEGYSETIIKEGGVAFNAFPDLILQASWILQEPRPDVVDTLISLFSDPKD